jgi:hydrogenase maturation protease
MRNALIIGLGNPDRGDDAAGLLVADSLRERGAEAIAHTGGTLDLIEIWAETERVIVVDAVLSGGAPGTVRTWHGSNTVLKKRVFRSSTHGFGLADAMELSRALNHLPKDLTIYGIEAAQFLSGSPPSRAVLAGVNLAVEKIGQIVFRNEPRHDDS